jgi:hypothetical protein
VAQMTRHARNRIRRESGINRGTEMSKLFTRRLVLNSERQPAKADEDDQHEGERCMCRGCVQTYIDTAVRQAIADIAAKASGTGARGDDAGKRRPAAHSAPLVVHGYFAGDLEPASSAALVPNGYLAGGGEPNSNGALLPGGYLTEARKAS